MEIKLYENNKIAEVISSQKLIVDTQSALDLMTTIQYEANTDRVIISKELIIDDFFNLRTGIAGEILQKFINYQIKIAIYGDFSNITSKALRDFIYECNNGSNIFFANSLDEAIAYLK